MRAFLLTFFVERGIIFKKGGIRMIREFSAKAKPTNKMANMAFAACTSVGFALVLTSMLVENYRGIISLFGVLGFAAAVAIYSRYVSAVYYYDITFDSEGTPLFVVRQLIGKRETTLCRIALCEIQKIEQQTRKQSAEHKTPYTYRKYSYLPTLMPSLSYRITSVSRYEKAEIIIEASGEFINLLGTYVEEAKENYIEE